MADKDEQLAQFQSITGCDADRAQFFLESSNWQLDLAMASFYEGDGDTGPADMETGAADPPPAAAASQAAPAAGKINIVSGNNDDDDEDDSSDEDGQAFFAGGSQHSGNVVSKTNFFFKYAKI